MPTVYATAPADDAGRIAETLVEERLAACVNRFPCRSTYRWEGAVVDDEEEILLAKTGDDVVDRLIERLETLHPYDVPCIEVFDEERVVPSFATWREDATE